MTIFGSAVEWPGACTIAPSVHKMSAAFLAIPSMAAFGRQRLSERVDSLLDNIIACAGWETDCEQG